MVSTCNLLVVRPEVAGFSFSLWTARNYAVNGCPLSGRAAQVPGDVHVTIKAEDCELFNQVVVREGDSEFALSWVFAWLSLNHIRVDAVVHQSEKGLESVGSQLVTAVAAFAPDLPQVTLSASPGSPEFDIEIAALLRPPVTCLTAPRVRCERCSSANAIR